MTVRDPRFYTSPFNIRPDVKAGAAFPPRVVLHDITLREGSQASAVAFSVQDKVEIARLLDEAGIPQIEVGYGTEDRAAIKAMKRAGVKAQITILAPAFRQNWQEAIDTALDAGADVILVLFRSSDRQIEMLGIDREEALRRLSGVVEYAVRRGARQVAFNTSFTPLADPGFLDRMYRTAYEAGAGRFGIADSTGVATPETIAHLVRLVRRIADVPVSVHVHDDFGLAVANALAGLRSGASIADVCVLGLGERAGNTPTEELAVALEGLYGVDTSIRLENLCALAQAVSRITGVPIPANKAVVGEDVFAQKLEMHVEVTARDPGLHEPFSPDLVGNRRVLRLGSGSGPTAVRMKLRELGLDVREEIIPALVTWVNQQALANKRVVSDIELADEARRLAERKEAQ